MGTTLCRTVTEGPDFLKVVLSKMSLENENSEENVVFERRMKVVSAVPPDVDYTLALKRPQITSTIAGILNKKKTFF